MAFIPGPALLDFLSHLLHTTFITDGRQLQMNQRYVDELRQKYIKNPPEGMTPKLVRNMTDSDLLDMHYFCLLYTSQNLSILVCRPLIRG